MGELLLCSQQIASVPYYIDTVSLNVYSLEEICYYLCNNTELLEPEFMDEELVEWIRTELKTEDLADRLHRLRTQKGTLLEFVKELLSACSYCSMEERLRVERELRAFENKSPTECRKIRTDRLLAAKKYQRCIIEYQSLLEDFSLKERGKEFEGSVLHNMGTAYAGLFLFEKAADCYHLAYEKNQDQRSLRGEKEALLLAAGEFKADKEDMTEAEFQSGLSDFKGAKETIDAWKEAYRLYCR